MNSRVATVGAHFAVIGSVIDVVNVVAELGNLCCRSCGEGIVSGCGGRCDGGGSNYANGEGCCYQAGGNAMVSHV